MVFFELCSKNIPPSSPGPLFISSTICQKITHNEISLTFVKNSDIFYKYNKNWNNLLAFFSSVIFGWIKRNEKKLEKKYMPNENIYLLTKIIAHTKNHFWYDSKFNIFRQNMIFSNKYNKDLHQHKIKKKFFNQSLTLTLL